MSIGSSSSFRPDTIGSLPINRCIAWSSATGWVVAQLPGTNDVYGTPAIATTHHWRAIRPIERIFSGGTAWIGKKKRENASRERKIQIIANGYDTVELVAIRVATLRVDTVGCIQDGCDDSLLADGQQRAIPLPLTREPRRRVGKMMRWRDALSPVGRRPSRRKSLLRGSAAFVNQPHVSQTTPNKEVNCPPHMLAGFRCNDAQLPLQFGAGNVPVAFGLLRFIPS